MESTDDIELFAESIIIDMNMGYENSNIAVKVKVQVLIWLFGKKSWNLRPIASSTPTLTTRRAPAILSMCSMITSHPTLKSGSVFVHNIDHDMSDEHFSEAQLTRPSSWPMSLRTVAVGTHTR